jgi:glucosamine-6-phosphate deaminase
MADSIQYNPFEQTIPYVKGEPDSMHSTYERMKVEIIPKIDGIKLVAREIVNLILKKQAASQVCVLGLATGATMVEVYAELVKIHKLESISFKNVVSFNLDEYYPIERSSPNSYWTYMHENLFNHIDMIPENIHVPNGEKNNEATIEECQKYEQLIEKYGGIDFQLLGIGRAGHIGFNEPGSSIYSKTRVIHLHPITIADAVKDFKSENNVPKKAITMGISTILNAKHIVMLAWGSAKADIIYRAVEGDISDKVPSTYLQNHMNCTVYIDQPASIKLTRSQFPWLVGSIQWDKKLKKKAVLWLCEKIKKPLLKLIEADYILNGLMELIRMYKSYSDLNIEIFNDVQHTITGWPGGKPMVNDSTRPERSLPYPKKVLIFAPHPDDDVVGMGGCEQRLVKQNHDVHIAYQTTGHHNVIKETSLRYHDFMKEFLSLGEGNKKLLPLLKPQEECDTKAINIAIRRSESLASCRYLHVPLDHISFLDFGFYDTGKITDEDVKRTIDLIGSIKPHQIYFNGDNESQNATNKLCFEIIKRALAVVFTMEWAVDLRVWLYKSVQTQWPLYQVDMAIPLSPEEVSLKRNSIFFHQSQKDFYNPNKKELWKIQEEKDHSAAVLLDQIGLPEYESVELFVRYGY